MRRLLTLALFAAGACSGGPGPSGADATVTPPRDCETRADCESRGVGLVCSVDGICQGCGSDGECTLREACDPQERRCVFRPGWGDDCGRSDDCAVGQVCKQGLCVDESQAVLCAQGSCLGLGMRCNRETGVCEEDLGCMKDDDCASTEKCNLPTNACVARCTPETEAKDCARRQRCFDGVCSECAADEDCASGLVCLVDKLVCAFSAQHNCTSDRDCPIGQVCNRAASLCIDPPPPCLSNEDCLPDERCDLGEAKCVRRACAPDRYEPNDDRDRAALLAAGVFSNLTLCDGVPDWYAVKLSRGDRLSVFVEADAFFEDAVEIELLDGADRTLAAGKLSLAQTVSEDAGYFLRLVSTDTFVDYGLRLSVSRGTPCDDDRFEPNDTLAFATPLNGAATLDGLSLCGLDQDVFSVPIRRGVTIRAALTLDDPAAGDGDVVLRDEAGVEIARSAQSGPMDEVLLAWPVEETRCYIEVLSSDARAHATYRLTVSFP